MRIPVAEVDDLSRENVELLAPALAESGPDRPALVYCTGGDRAAALLTLKQVGLDGVDPATAMEFGRSAGLTGQADAVEEILGL